MWRQLIFSIFIYELFCGGGLKCIFLVPSAVKTHIFFYIAWMLPNYFDVSSQRNSVIKLTHYDDTKKRANDSQRVRAKENLKSSHGGPNQRQAPGTKKVIKALRQVRHWVCRLTHRPAIEEETMPINHDWVYNQTCRLSYTMLYTTL